MLSRTGWLVLALAGCATAPSMDLEELADELAAYDVVFLGEQHDNAAGHAQHHDLVRLLHAKRPEIVIALEFFERDVQEVVDDYLAGRIDESEFLANARPPRTYRRFYRPYVELAKAHALDLVAANAPRDAVRAFRMGEEIPADLRPFVARETSAPRDAYWAAFQAAMAGHDGVDEETMFGFYRAQCLWDDTMAESVVAAASGRDPAPLVVLVVGEGHVRDGLGTAAKVAARRPDLRCAILTMDSRPNVVRLGADRYELVVPSQPELPKRAAATDSRPTTQPASRPTPEPTPGARPGLGLMPDYDSIDGVTVEMVREGGPADRGGLEVGDVIVRFGEHEVTDVRSYMQALGAHAVGDVVQVQIDRGGEFVTLEITVGESRR